MLAKNQFKKRFSERGHEQSFSLFETVIAIGLLASILLSVNGVQGNAIYSVEYQENLSKASWLAKGLMAKVEYEWNTRDFKELEFTGQEQKINDLTWGDGSSEAYKDFAYRVSIEEWKLPLMRLLLSGMGGGEDDSQGGAFGGEFIESKVKEVLGDELLKVAHVEVFWPEGATRGSTDLTLALTNERSLDKFISNQKGLIKPPKKSNKPKSVSGQNSQGSQGGQGGQGSDRIDGPGEAGGTQ